MSAAARRQYAAASEDRTRPEELHHAAVQLWQDCGLTRRGEGLGQQMMAACEDWVKARGMPKIQFMVRTTNLATLGFYEHLGYVTQDVVVLGCRFDDQDAAG
jgi:GNAT superfamily N-acetyltransferase